MTASLSTLERTFNSEISVDFRGDEPAERRPPRVRPEGDDTVVEIELPGLLEETVRAR
jgi:hypothetical protein